MKHLFGNQQVTNALSKQVGTSEAIRPLTYSHSEVHWNQWLAGLIDGDGTLIVRDDTYTCCEITMDLRDEHALQQVKAKLGGSVKLRSGVRAIRYRLHHKKGMEELLLRINGEIRQSSRQEQLKKICIALNVPYKAPKESKANKESAWFSGFFDADGTITLSMKNGNPQVTIGVSNKKTEELFGFQQAFNGNIYFDKASNTYKWSIQRERDLMNFLEYIKKFPPRSRKKTRLHLLPIFFEYKRDGFYRAKSESLQLKAWLKFLGKWNFFESNQYIS